MRFLLDTHTFIWALSDTKRLPVAASTVITDAGNELLISAVSFWEIAIKARNGRLAPIGKEPSTLVKAAEEMGFIPIQLAPAEAATQGSLTEDTHFDPFDRMLIWQAIQRDLILISGDPQFKRFAADGLKL